METIKTKSRPALLALRAVIAFILLGALVAVLYWVGYDAYPDVAEWREPGYRDAVIMDGETYYEANGNPYCTECVEEGDVNSLMRICEIESEEFFERAGLERRIYEVGGF
jgi:hypothetical protein